MTGGGREWRSRALPSRRAVVIAAAGLVPWLLIPYESGVSLVFSFGLVDPASLHLQSVTEYVFASARALPPSLLAYPTAALLYAVGIASAALVRVDREDRRITAGLFVLAGLDVLYFAVAFSSRRLRIVAFPAGTALLWLAAWESRP